MCMLWESSVVVSKFRPWLSSEIHRSYHYLICNKYDAVTFALHSSAERRPGRGANH